jgi:hypothetical protein
MTIVGNNVTNEEKVIARFSKYLNGPMGRTVLDNLEEGEDFVLQTYEHTLRVQKRRGRAVVTMMKLPLV